MHRLLISLNVTRPFSRNVTRKQHQKQQNKSNNHFSNTIKLPLEQEKKRWSDLDLFQSASLCKNLLARGKYEDLRGEKKSQEGKGSAEPGAQQSQLCCQLTQTELGSEHSLAMETCGASLPDSQHPTALLEIPDGKARKARVAKSCPLLCATSSLENTARLWIHHSASWML